MVFDSRERRGQGPGAALLQDIASVLSQALDSLPQTMTLMDDVSLETFLGSVVTSVTFEYQ
jgi:hypothetical protein